MPVPHGLPMRRTAGPFDPPRKRTEPGEDILSDLARDDDLGIDELTGIAFLLLLGGHETTANMLGLGAFALLEHPEQLAALRADMNIYGVHALPVTWSDR